MATAFSFPLLPKPISPSHPLFSSIKTRLSPYLCTLRLFPKIPSSSSGNYSSRPSETDCPVPHDQQPINEYQSLSTSSPFDWASGDFVEYCSRLFATGAGFALFVGLPVSWYGSVGVGWDPVQRVLGAVSSGLYTRCCEDVFGLGLCW